MTTLFALKNIVKEVCDYWYEHREINRENITTTDLAKIFNIEKQTIRIYLKNGTKLGWCNYNPKEEHKRSGRNNGKNNGKKVICIELNKTFPSATDAGRNLNINPSHISMVCKEKRKTCGGYHWKYIEEENN